ncbi:WD40-repeat-containing domain protein [Chytridium lagenaria]|nr:WD40-repeat-containing domain protein [Chytridium lagenaria]
MEAIEGTPYVAVGSASSGGSLTILENTSDSTNHQLQLRSVFSSQHPVYSLSAMGNRLITAGPNSRVQIFNISPRDLSQRGKGVEQIGDCAFGSGKLEEVKLAPPGMRNASVRVHHVEFMPANGGKTANPTKFLAVEEKALFIWDLEGNKVVGKETISKDQLTSASWSPHPGSLLATGGVDRDLYVLDSRLIGMDTNKSAVWMQLKAHSGQNHPAITSVQFSPFVPYWLASAGEDSVVKIWDLRYLQVPMCRIDGHYRGIRSLSWSNTHANVISTGSDDNLWRAWAIDSTISVPRIPALDMFIGCPGTEWGDPAKMSMGFGMVGAKAAKSGVCVGGKIIAEHKSPLQAPIVSCMASPSHINSFYSLSASGEVSFHTFTDTVFKHVAPQRYLPDQYPQESSIESSVHSRNLKQAFTSVVQLSRASLAANRTVGRTERLMIELCTAKQPVEGWVMPVLKVNKMGDAVMGNREDAERSAMEGLAKFRLEVDTFSYFLPPNFGSLRQWYDMIPAQSRLEFEMVVLRFNILVDVLKGNWETITKAEKMICKGMERSNLYGARYPKAPH